MKRLLIPIGIFVVLLAVSMVVVVMESEKEDAARTSEFDRQWGANFRSFCSTTWPERLGPAAQPAKIAFLVPQLGNDPATSTVRQAGLWPKYIAQGRADLTHVACVRFTPVVVETCKYSGGVTVERRRYVSAVTLVDVRSRTIVARWTGEGALPERCPLSISRSNRPGPIDGPEADFISGLLRADPAFGNR